MSKAVGLRVSLEKLYLDLREENSMLKMKLFWKNYGVRDLIASMFSKNAIAAGAPKCTCFSCCLSRNSDDMIVLPFQSYCTLKPWIERRIQDDLGMTIVDADPMLSTEHVCNPGGTVYGQDAHFVRITKCDFVDLTYGARIFDVQTPDDPELKKLTRLFNSLNAFPCDDDM